MYQFFLPALVQNKMYTRIFLVFFILSFITIISESQRDKKFFRKDYKYVEATKSFYKVHTVYTRWENANQRCEREGASLFYPENYYEAQTVLNMWNETLDFRRSAYIGISDLTTRGVFETIDGIPINDVYHNWSSGEPNNKNNRENCVILKRDGTLNDVDCSERHSSYCKKTLASLEWNQPCDMPFIDYKYNEELGRCYKFHSKPANWSDADNTCIAENSYLAIINSQSEADYLVALAESAPKHMDTIKYMAGSVFLGFYERSKEGWVTIREPTVHVKLSWWRGVPLNESGYTNWAPGKPDGDFRGVDEYCGAMLYNGQLNDVRCQGKAHFICEHELDTHKLSSTSTTDNTFIVI